MTMAAIATDRHDAPRWALALAGLVLGGAPAGATPPRLLADRPVDVALRTAPASGNQNTTAMAFGAGKHLAVWLEPASSVVYAARVDAAKGTLLDDPPIAVFKGANVDFPAVGFDGKRFLVVWAQNGDLSGAHVEPATGALGQPFPVVVKTNPQDNPAVAGGLDAKGNPVSLVAWHDSASSPPRARAALLDGNGAFLRDVNGKSLADMALSANGLYPNGTPIEANPPAVAAGAPGRFLATWTESYSSSDQVMAIAIDVSGALGLPTRIDGNGDHDVMVLDAQRRPVSFTVPLKQTRFPTVAFDGLQYLVAWSDYRDVGSRASLYGRLVGNGGNPVAPDFRVARPPVASDELLRAQAGLAAGAYLMAYESVDLEGVAGSRLLAGRVSLGGQPLDGDGVVVGRATVELGEARRATLSSDGKRAAVAFASTPLIPSRGVSKQDVLLTSIDPAGLPQIQAPIPPLALQRQANLERRQALATNGAVFLLVWEDDRDYATSGLDLYGMRFDASGKPLDVDGGGAPRPFVICDQPGDQAMPAVAAWAEGGGDFLVTWSDGRGVNFNESEGAMALHGTLVGSVGPPAEPAGHPLTNNPAGGQLASTVAASPDGFLVAWEDWRYVNNLQVFAEVWAVAVGVDGKAGGEQAVAAANLLDPLTIACAPALAWNGRRFFVAYEQPCSQWPGGELGGPSHVVGAWLGADGKPAPGGSVLVASNPKADEKAAQVAAGSGGALLVVWRATKDGGGDEIRTATLADQAAAVVGLGSLDGSGVGVREAPAITLSASRGVGLVTWVDTVPVGGAPAGVYGVRIDGALRALDAAPFAFVTGADAAVFRVPTPPTRSDGIFTRWPAGGDVAALPRTTPPATAIAMPTGEALVAYALLEQGVARQHVRVLGLARPGGACSGASQCGDGICTSRGVCCDTVCEGTCRTCTENGCVGVPQTDTRCGGAQGAVISCAALDTECRHYGDLPANHCAAFGQCAEPGNLAECSVWTDVPDGTPCSAIGCDGGGASCRLGLCACPGASTRLLGDWATAGCSMRGAPGPRPGRSSPGLPYVLLALVTLLALTRRRP